MSTAAAGARAPKSQNFARLHRFAEMAAPALLAALLLACAGAGGPNPPTPPSHLAAAAAEALQLASFHPGTAAASQRVGLLRRLYLQEEGPQGGVDGAAQVLQDWLEQDIDGVDDSCDSEAGAAAAGAAGDPEPGPLARLQRFAAAVRRHLPPPTAPSVAVVVVGAGPAGLLTAAEAAASGATVTVVEKRRRYTRPPHPAHTPLALTLSNFNSIVW